MKLDDLSVGQELEWVELEELYRSLDSTKCLKDLSYSEGSSSAYLKYGNAVLEFEETNSGFMYINKYVMEFL